MNDGIDSFRSSSMSTRHQLALVISKNIRVCANAAPYLISTLCTSSSPALLYCCQCRHMTRRRHRGADVLQTTASAAVNGGERERSLESLAAYISKGQRIRVVTVFPWYQIDTRISRCGWQLHPCHRKTQKYSVGLSIKTRRRNQL